MDFRLHWIDVSKALEERIQPYVQIERPRIGGEREASASVFGRASLSFTGEFWVPTNPLNVNDFNWKLTVKGQYVRVPVHAYMTGKTAKSLLAATALELGFRAGFDLVRRCPKKPVVVTLVMGHKCDTVNDKFQYYFGLAVQVD